MNNIVKNPTRKAVRELANKQFTANSQLADRLLRTPNLQDFLYGWFAMGRLALAEPCPEMAMLLQGSRKTWLKAACATAYISGYVSRDWDTTVRILVAQKEN